MDCLELLGPENSLAKYMYLRDLQDRNRTLFYRLLQSHGKQMLPLVYTPTVGLACQQYSLVSRRARGLFITAEHTGKVAQVLANYPVKDVRAIVVTDGERILGLGDLGANGMGIPVGKIALYTAVGGVSPSFTLPITIDVGTNTESILANEHYIGLRQKRITGQAYDRLLDEFMDSVAKRWGRSCLVQFEDFGNKNAWRLLRKYQSRYCTFNDDIQGTAAVSVAGILASLKVTNSKIADHKFLFLGAGEAALGIADLLAMAIVKSGLSETEARARIHLIDSQGLITKDKPRNDAHKDSFAKELAQSKDLLQIVELVSPTVLIGAATQPGAFSPQVLTKMAQLNRTPVVFALSNPTCKAECTAEDAYRHTEGRVLFASGSPFDPVTLNGRTFHPAQCNNVYIFPAVAFAVVCCRVYTIPDEVFLVAAETLAQLTSPADFDNGALYPPLDSIRDTSLQIAVKVAEFLYSKGLAHAMPEPTDKMTFLKSKLYDASYAA